MFWMAEISDKVEYDGVLHQVEDVMFVPRFTDNKMSRMMEGHKLSNGAILRYLIVDIETDYGIEKPEKFWINADAVDPEEIPSLKRTRQPQPIDTIQDFFDQDKESIHLQYLGKSMLGWADGLKSLPDNDKLPEIITYLMAVQYDKEGFYGSSWKGKGEYRGIMANIDRKYDRLDKMVSDEIAGIRPKLPDSSTLTDAERETIGESKIDAIADLTVYGLLYLTWLREHKAGAFKLWVDKNVPKYLSDKIPFVSNYYR